MYDAFIKYTRQSLIQVEMKGDPSQDNFAKKVMCKT